MYKKVKFRKYFETGREFNNEGLFMGWGLDYEEFDNGIGIYSLALIKLPNGTIEEVLPKDIKFED